MIAEAENGLVAIQAAEALHPDLVFLDISMPVLDGFQAAVQFRWNLPTVRTIVVSSHSDKAYVERAFLSGAQAYVMKGSAVFQIPEAIEPVMGGGTFRAGSRSTGREAGGVVGECQSATGLGPHHARDL